MGLLLFAVLACAAGTLLPPPNSKDVLLLAFSAYCGDAVAANFSCYWCTKLSKPFEVVGRFGVASGSGFGFVGIYDASTIVVSYRGTDNLGGWIKDAEFTQRQLPNAPAGVRVHDGFYNVSSSDRPAIARLYASAQQACGGACPVLMTGHSLGASLTTLAGYFLASDIGNVVPVAVLNFGSPRLFNPAGAAWFSANRQALGVVSLVRVTSTRDPVPHLPPADFIEHYQHVPQEVYETSNSPLAFRQCSPTNGEDPNCTDSVPWYKFDILDHARYMGFNALDGVPHGCLYTDK